VFSKAAVLRVVSAGVAEGRYLHESWAGVAARGSLLVAEQLHVEFAKEVIEIVVLQRFDDFG
jgi:hypothetical protein